MGLMLRIVYDPQPLTAIVVPEFPAGGVGVANVWLFDDGSSIAFDNGTTAGKDE